MSPHFNTTFVNHTNPNILAQIVNLSVKLLSIYDGSGVLAIFSEAKAFSLNQRAAFFGVKSETIDTRLGDIRPSILPL